jgi:predicted TIM-barrel fold metal-dependent hydrolase
MTPSAPSRPDPVDRRTFLKVGALGVGSLAGDAAAEPPRQLAALSEGAQDEPRAGSLVDVNVYLSRWPFRRLPGDETAALVAELRRQGVAQAWAGSFDALLHRDIGGVNARLAEECRTQGSGILVPFGTINPKLPDWQEDLRRCVEEYRMPGIRLHPNYHNYKLDDADFARLLDLAAEKNLLVQLAATMEDERTQHPLLHVPHVDLAPLAEHARKRPGLRMVLLNAFRSLRAESAARLVAAGAVSVEIAMLELVGGVSELIRKVPVERVLYGSYAPFFYMESALFKLKESPLSTSERQAIASGNARALFVRA